MHTVIRFWSNANSPGRTNELPVRNYLYVKTPSKYPFCLSNG